MYFPCQERTSTKSRHTLPIMGWSCTEKQRKIATRITAARKVKFCFKIKFQFYFGVGWTPLIEPCQSVRLLGVPLVFSRMLGCIRSPLASKSIVYRHSAYRISGKRMAPGLWGRSKASSSTRRFYIFKRLFWIPPWQGVFLFGNLLSTSGGKDI